MRKEPIDISYEFEGCKIMKFDAIFYALEVADAGSFSQAARNLYLSQPNLSYAVRQLEQDLGVQLFLRVPGGVVPTEAGQELIERFRIIRREYDQIQEISRLPHRDFARQLRVGSLRSSRAARAFTLFAKEYAGEGCRFSFLNYDTLDSLIEEITTNKLDLAVIGTFSTHVKTMYGKLKNCDLEYHLIGRSPLCAVVGKANPLYGREEPVQMAELYPFTAVQYGPTANDPSHSLLHETGLSLHAAGEISVTGAQIFFDLITETDVIGLVAARPEAFRKYHEEPEIWIVPVSDCELMGEFGWIKPNRTVLPEPAQKYLDILLGLY